MRRLVLVGLTIEVLLALVVVYGALTDRSDPAGRGLATVYALAIGVPVALALLLVALGWTRTGGVALLIVPALALALYLSNRSTSREIEAARAGEGWFTAPTALALSRAIAAGDTVAMRHAAAADTSAVNAIAEGGDGTMLTHTILEFPQMTQALLALGANASLVAPNGMSPLVAAVTKDPFTVRLLLEHGADPNVRFMREPVIFNAFRTNRRAEALMLATQGADVTLRNERGATTAMAAASNYMFDVAAALIERGADVQAADTSGRTIKTILEDSSLAPYHNDVAFTRLVAVLKSRGIALSF